MAIDSISLLAQNSYVKIQSQPTKIAAENNINPAQQASKFQAIVEQQFNSFAKLSPAEILRVIQNARNSTTTPAALVASAASAASTNADVISQATQSLRKALQSQDKVARKFLINEASLIDVLTTTTEAKNIMDLTVKVRDKFIETFDKVMSMSV